MNTRDFKLFHEFLLRTTRVAHFKLRNVSEVVALWIADEISRVQLVSTFLSFFRMATHEQTDKHAENSEFHYYCISASLFPNSSTANSCLSAGPSEFLLL